MMMMLVLLLLLHSASSFRGVPVFSSSSSSSYDPRRRRSVSFIATTSTTSTALGGLLDFLNGGMPSNEDSSNNSIDNIPPEIRNEIYIAESKTAAAKGRQQRIIIYFTLTLLGITIAFGNAFLSDLRYGEGSPSTDLAYYGFGWVQSNFITSFILMNKIGGALGLLGAGLSGTLAEVEVRSKKESIEKIWTEMQRRQSLKEEGVGSKKKRRLQQSSSGQLLSSNRRDMTGKQKKRLSALEEVLDTTMDDELTMPSTLSNEAKDGVVTVDNSIKEENTAVDDNTNNNNEGILGAVTGFYKKADSMAASQALLLNKELEDRGIIEKITDETGLKVVGKKQNQSKD